MGHGDRRGRRLKAAFAPEGVNVGVNLGQPAGGSVSEHLHVHVVPRWTGDANFMTATANTRTLPEALPDSATKIRAAVADRLRHASRAGDRDANGRRRPPRRAAGRPRRHRVRRAVPVPRQLPAPHPRRDLPRHRRRVRRRLAAGHDSSPIVNDGCCGRPCCSPSSP